MEQVDIDNIISTLGHTLLTDLRNFEQAAKQAALRLDSKDLDYLKSKFHQPPNEPQGVKDMQLGLGQWMAVCQYAIFELLYNLQEISLSLVKEVAFGVYDWTQATALEVLCRWYVKGTLSKSIIAEIGEKIGDMRYETHLYFGRGLLIRKKTDERYGNILNEIENKEFHEAVKELTEI